MDETFKFSKIIKVKREIDVENFILQNGVILSNILLFFVSRSKKRVFLM